MQKIKKTLKKRYENLLAQVNKLNSQDVFQLFMDAFTEAIDPHTSYFNPANAANFNIEMSRQLEGIGAGLNTEKRLHHYTFNCSGRPWPIRANRLVLTTELLP